MEYNLDLLNCFNRFANYLEKNNSSIRIKIENDNIMFSDRTFVFDCKHDNNNIHYVPWFLIFEKPPLETQIDYFFFGKNCESAKNSNIPVLVSIFEYCNAYSIDKCQMAPFGVPSCLEELAIKMDLMGI
jgi:hypothetical protein